MSAGRRFFSGESEAQAVLEAAGHFGLSPGELAYRPVEKKHGFLRRPKVVIEVDAASPRRPPASPGDSRASAPSVETPVAAARHEVLSQRTGGDQELAPAITRAAAAVADVVALAGLRLSARGEVVSGEGGDEVCVELGGADRPLLIARQGELLRTCEYLARRMVRELPVGGLNLDSGGFREDRAETLRRRAAAAAEEVRRSGEPVRFEPLPAAERRILHLAIQGERAVRSQSEGQGDLRSVCVLLGEDRGENQDRQEAATP